LSRKYKVPLGLVGLSSDPVSATDGDIYYNTDTDVVRVYANGAWANIASAGSGIANVVEDLTPQLGGDLDAQGNNITDVEYLGLDTTPAAEPTAAGSFWWNSEFETANLQLDTNVTLQVGQEHVIRVKNNSGSVAIPNFTFVMFAGATGDTVTVAPAVTDGTYPDAYMVGITTEEIPADGFGFVTQIGFVNGVDTNSYTLGQLLYPDPAVAGGFTTTKPAAPAFNAPIAAVTKVNASSGRVLVRMWAQGESSSGALTANPTLIGPLEPVNTAPAAGAFSTPTYVGVTSTNFGSSTTGTLTLPAELYSGDIVFAFISCDLSNQTPGVTDWTLVSNISGDVSSALYYKIMGATPDATAAVTSIGTASVGICAAFRNYSGDIFDVTTVSASGASGDPDPASITTVTDNAMLVAFGAQDDDNLALSAPSGFTLLASQTASTTGHTVAAATLATTTAGTVDPAVFSSSGDDAWTAFTVAIKPRAAYINVDVSTSANVEMSDPDQALYSINVRGDSSNTLNSIMSVGEQITVGYTQALKVPLYSRPELLIDGVQQVVSWDVADYYTYGTLVSYEFNILKTGANTYACLVKKVLDGYQASYPKIVSSTTGSTGSTAGTLTLPTEAVLGDLVYVYTVSNQDLQTTPSGWTTLASNNGSSLKASAFYKVVGSSGLEASLDLIDYQSAVAVLIRGAYHKNPVYSVNYKTSTTTSEDPASVVVPDVYGTTSVVLVGVGVMNTSSVSVSNTPPTGYTLINRINGGATSEYQGVALFYKNVTTAGTEDPGTVSVTSGRSSSFTLVLNP
jgi:hypothetical protein